MKRINYLILGTILIFSCNKENSNSDSGSVPAVIISDTKAITSMSAEIEVNVLSDESRPIFARGVCWDTVSNPTLDDNHTSDNIGNGTFISLINNLKPSTKYFIRAYATNDVGTNYSSEINFITNSILIIGEHFQGGVIAYIFKTGDPGYVENEQHGLIVAPHQSKFDGVPWYNGEYKSTGATGTAIGTGKANTDLIVNSQGDGYYAAKLCYDLDLNGYSDWYLPSKDELFQIFINRELIKEVYNFHWSSSEVSSEKAWGHNINLGNMPINVDKQSSNNICPVRNF